MESPKVRMALNPLRSKAISLYGAATQQAWGRPGRSSLAAHINSHNKTAPTHPDQQYSEFIVSSKQPHQAVLEATPTVSLHDYIQSQVIEVDPSVIHFYRRLHSQGLPYTLRIVSVAYPQPLRVHPDAETCKSLAEELSFQNPIGRPVMLVALDQVDCLFGFQSFSSIAGELLRVPEFMDAVGQTAAEQFVRKAKSSSVSQTDVGQLILGLLETENLVSECLSAAASRLRKMPRDSVSESDLCFMSLQQLYPDDPMCFAVYFLNRVKLKEGNAIFIHENEPYTVLEGDFMEVSTSSDAYVIGGLSNAAKHPNIFARSLSYDDSPIEISNGESVSECGVSYVPPVPEFQLLDFKLPGGVSQQMVETITPSVILVLEGSGCIAVDAGTVLMPLRVGSLYYLSPQTSFLVTSRKGSLDPLRFIQIGVNESAAPSRSSGCSVM